MFIVAKTNDDNGFKLGIYAGKVFKRDHNNIPSVKVNWLQTLGAGMDAIYKTTHDKTEPTIFAEGNIILYGEDFLTKHNVLRKNVWNFISKNL